MIRKDKKVRKRRGYRTHGYGRIGQHRNKGQQGGFGNTGLKKGKKIWRIKYAPELIGKHGFTRPSQLVSDSKCLNLYKLQEKLPRYIEMGLAKKTGSKFSLDLKQMGIDKLLGAGNVTVAIEVTVKSASKKALEKIQAAGGKIIFPVENE